jgi:hypothetical protein
MQFDFDEFYIFYTLYRNIRRSGIPKRYSGKDFFFTILQRILLTYHLVLRLNRWIM